MTLSKLCSNLDYFPFISTQLVLTVASGLSGLAYRQAGAPPTLQAQACQRAFALTFSVRVPLPQLILKKRD